MHRRLALKLLAGVVAAPLLPRRPAFIGLDLSTSSDYTVITGNFPGGAIDHEAFFQHAVRPWLTANDARFHLTTHDVEFVSSALLPKNVGVL